MENPGYSVVIEKVAESDDWVASHPLLKGCIADGKTPEEALASLNVCRGLWIESREHCGLGVPKP